MNDDHFARNGRRIFSHPFPGHLVNSDRFRIMDCFLADGLEVIFRLALALLQQGRNDLLLQDMEGVIRVRGDS